MGIHTAVWARVDTPISRQDGEAETAAKLRQRKEEIRKDGKEGDEGKQQSQDNRYPRQDDGGEELDEDQQCAGLFESLATLATTEDNKGGSQHR